MGGREGEGADASQPDHLRCWAHARRGTLGGCVWCLCTFAAERPSISPGFLHPTSWRRRRTGLLPVRLPWPMACACVSLPLPSCALIFSRTHPFWRAGSGSTLTSPSSFPSRGCCWDPHFPGQGEAFLSQACLMVGTECCLCFLISCRAASFSFSNKLDQRETMDSFASSGGQPVASQHM